MEPSYKFFSNTACKYFPCHKTENPDEFNCLTCFCPLFALGNKCGGNFEYTARGVKTCIGCTLPHKPEYYDTIIAKLIQGGPSHADA